MTVSYTHLDVYKRQDQLLIMLLAETGYRIGEILGVNYTRDIDYERHTYL